MTEQLVSVVIPFYNSKKYISATLQCIIDQDYNNLEIILIDDQSTDGSRRIVENFKDDRIIIFDGKGKGATAAYNLGFANSSGEFIAIMDHDDICDKTRISKQINILKKTDIDVLGSSYGILDQNGKLSYTITLPENDNEIKQLLLEYAQGVFNPSLMIKKEIFRKYGYYEEQFYPVSDYHFYLTHCNSIKFGNIIEPLYYWRSLSSSISHRRRHIFNKHLFKVSHDYICRQYSQKNINKIEKYRLLAYRAYYTNHLFRTVKYSFNYLINKGNDKNVKRFFINSSVFFVLIIIARKYWLFENKAFYKLKNFLIKSK